MNHCNNCKIYSMTIQISKPNDKPDDVGPKVKIFENDKQITDHGDKY